MIPFSFQFRLDGTVTYKEALQIHNVGSAGAHVPFTEGFDGTYRTQGNRVVMEFTDTGRILGVQKAYGYGMGTATPLNEPVCMEMEILQVQGDTIVLQWLSGGPFYFEAPNDFEMIPQALAEGPLRFRSVALAGEFPGGFESSYDWPYNSVLTRPDTPAGRNESFPASDICDVRSGPGQEYGAADEAIPAGTWVTKIGQMAGNDDWYFVEYSRDYHYDGYPQGAGDPAGFVYRFYGWVSTECLTGA